MHSGLEAEVSTCFCSVPGFGPREGHLHILYCLKTDFNCYPWKKDTFCFLQVHFSAFRECRVEALRQSESVHHLLIDALDFKISLCTPDADSFIFSTF